MRTKLQLILFVFILSASNTIIAQQLAFPGAEGYGRFATGGRGGDVYHVTNLTDAGVGSLRYGIESASGPRTIVFDVSGTINLTNRLRIQNHPNITIAGQTAPGDGITLARDAFYIYSDNVIVRYIRCRFGDVSGKEDDAASIVSGKNIIIDHVSASWSVDETFSCQSNYVDSLTIQWSMITESLHNSIHSKGAHGMGEIIGSLSQSFHHNIYAHHNSRSPKVTGRRHCLVDFRNNVIYNWGNNNCYDGTASYINWVNNYYKAGPATASDVRDRIFELSDEDIPGGVDNPENVPEDSQNFETSLYAVGNYVNGFPSVTANNKLGIDYMLGATEVKNVVDNPAFIAPPITTQTALEAYPLVVAGAGASLVRDAIDTRIANEILTGTTTYNGSVSGTPGIIDSQTDVGGWPALNSLPAPTDTDKDGMPDTWEVSKGLNPSDGNDRNNLDVSGYTMLEIYLADLINGSTLSIEESTTNTNKFICFPSIVKDILNIRFEANKETNATISIMDFNGMCVLENNLTTTNGVNTLSIDLKSLSTGTYLCLLKTNEFKGIQKFIKL